MGRRELLRDVMSQAGITQSDLARIAGVHQPSLSKFLSGRIDMSDDMLDRLLSAMGFRLEVVRHAVKVHLARSEDRSWRLHRQLAKHLSRQSLEAWLPTLERNMERLRSGTQGQPHQRHLDEWQDLIDRPDLVGLHRVLTGLDRYSIEMREVSPMRGLLSEAERLQVLGLAG